MRDRDPAITARSAGFKSPAARVRWPIRSTRLLFRRCRRAEAPPVQFACPSCHQVIEYQGPRPKFCQHCGEPLSGSQTDLADAETLIGPSVADLSMTLPDETQQLGEYRLLKELGRGGMGVVYEAEHTETGRRVALKVLSPKLPRNSVTVERFLREGRLAAAVSHPCSTFVYGAGESNGQLHIAMELVPGRTLARVVQEDGPLPINTAADYVLDVIDGLIAAHDVGVIHRDVKPSNCFLGEDNHVKVGDFGLSKSLVTDTSLTRTGEFMGTPQYAAPEQVRGGDVDARTDIYAVGATLYFLLSGRGPFVGDVASVIAQIASDKPAPLRGLRAEVPRELDRIVARSLAKDPAARFSSLAQFRQALLPYSTSGASIADLGRRLAAYFLDSMLCTISSTIVLMVVLMTLTLTGSFGMNNLTIAVQVAVSLMMLTVAVLYFTLCEGRWGGGIGKRLMGLRVVNLSGETPGLGRAFLRALLLPGLPLLPAVLLPLLFEPQIVPDEMPTFGSHVEWLHLIVGWMCTFGLLATMRARNGYRGMHELATGTRVVRPRQVGGSDQHRPQAVVAPVVVDQGRTEFGPFRITGTLGRSGAATVYQARDESLQRPVWIRVGDELDAEWRRRRINVTRRTRPVWLHGGSIGWEGWDAYEAVRGAPLSLLLKDAVDGRLPWEEGRRLLLQLAEELATASEDGTLPPTLSLEQVWVEPGGRVKLLDAPLNPLQGRTAPADPEQSQSDVERAVRLLQLVASLCTGGRALPVHARVFAAELAARAPEAGTLTWAVERLRDLSQQHCTLRWDDRLGVLATSMGTEQAVYMLYAWSVASGCSLLTGLSFPLRAVLAIGLALSLPAMLGYWLRGGPVFRLTGIAVRRTDQPAGRMRCSVRNLVAWTPNMLVWSGYGLLETFMSNPRQHDATFLMLAPLVWTFPMLIHIAGAFFALLSPRRGLQDLIAGTSLVHQ